MGKLNLLISLNAFTDKIASNNPAKNLIKRAFELNSFPVQDDAGGTGLFLAPGETKTLYSGMVTLAQDRTTAYTLAPTAGVSSSYTLTNVAGTAPNFRTPRVTGADATTEVDVTVNGAVTTFTSIPGTTAMFTGMISGMIAPITLTANTLGSAGNSIVLSGDGVSNIATLIAAWNTANPSNQVTLTAGNGNQVPNAGAYAHFTGVVSGVSTSVTITANTIGSIGNGATLIGNGTSNISTLITGWNTANPSNQITLTAGDGTQIPNGGLVATFSGTATGIINPVTINALNAGQAGNSVVLTGDGTSNLNTLIANWNILNPTNEIILSAGDGTQVLSNRANVYLSGGVNPAEIVLAGGLTSSIMLTGGTTATPLNLISGGVVVGDNVIIGSQFNPNNQGTYTVLSVTATSFSIKNTQGYTEGPITLGASFASQIQIFSAAGVQAGNTLVISSGFSPASWGSYLITGVGANFLTFASTAALPTESDIITNVVVYTAAKNLVYVESNQIVSLAINAAGSTTIEPFIDATGSCPGHEHSGVFLNKSTIYSLSITNISENTATVFFAAAE
jgi:hypothetical protein